MGQITKVTPDMIQVANNVTSTTVGNTTSGISLTFDSNGVITSAANVTLSVANTQLTGTINSAQIASNTISNTNIAAGAIENYSRATGILSGMRNRIINGAMVIDQRNAGASVTPTIDTYTLDRWKAQASQSSKFSVQQNAGSVTPPAGFTNYLGVTSLSAYSVGAGDYFAIDQRIEGYNMADLNFGSANAKTITISFWVRSSLTGTFGGCLTNNAFNRSYPFTYTISSANTWEQKSITVAGDTTGTWLTTNGLGMYVQFGLGVGSTYSGTAGSWAAAGYTSATGATSVVGTNGATFYITGVQLEVGSSVTSFETRSIGTELELCQRYYELVGDLVNGSVGQCLFADNYAPGVSSTTAQFNWFFRQQKRAAPTVTQYGTFILSGTVSGTINVTPSTPICVCLYANPATAGRIYWYNNPASGFSASAEL